MSFSWNWTWRNYVTELQVCMEFMMRIYVWDHFVIIFYCQKIFLSKFYLHKHRSIRKMSELCPCKLCSTEDKSTLDKTGGESISNIFQITKTTNSLKCASLIFMVNHILLTAALLKLKVFLAIPLACLARELLSMQGKLVNNKQTFSETKLLWDNNTNRHKLYVVV